MANWLNQIGTSINSWRIGLLGPLLKNNANAAVDVRNSSDSAFLPMRGADPDTEDGFTTRRWVNGLKSVVQITNQANASGGLGSNTGTPGYYVVTTAGSGAVLGDLLYDNGSGSGLRTIIPRAVRVLSIPIALVGGVWTFDPDSLYLWDAEGVAYVKIGDIGSVTGALRVCRWAINTSGLSQPSAFQMPANARVVASVLEITTPFTAGVTISLGIAGNIAGFQLAAENNPQAADAYKSERDVGVGGSAIAGLATLTGTLSAGAGIATLYFTVPN